MRISDWSSDVCSSDLQPVVRAIRFHALTVLVSASLVAGCTAVGPEYRAPALPAHVGETPTGLKEGRSPAYSPAHLPAHWWQIYDDPQPDELVEEELQVNTDLWVDAATLEW